MTALNNPEGRDQMTKDELIEAISADAGINKSEADKALRSVCDHISAALGNGEKLTIAGFGTFEPKFRPAGQGRNPRTGEAIPVGASAKAGFRAGAELKRILRPFAERQSQQLTAA